MNLILLTPDDFTAESRYVLRDRRAEHIRTVLRGQLGQIIRIGMLDGDLGTGEIVSLGESEIELECRFDMPSPRLSPTVDLICAVPRPKILRKVLYVSAMMGVRRLVFVRANRTDKSYLDSALLTPNGARPYLIEGLSQGGFTRLPEVIFEPLFRPFVEDRLDGLFCPHHEFVRLLIDPSGTQKIASKVAECDNCHIVAAVGPEGGWVDFERGLFELQQFVPITLGPWTLRVEFAVTALLAQLQLVASDRAPKG